MTKVEKPKSEEESDYMAVISGNAKPPKKKNKLDKNTTSLQGLVSKDKPTLDRSSLTEHDKALLQGLKRNEGTVLVKRNYSEK